jgi:hypothetical protein
MLEIVQEAGVSVLDYTRLQAGNIAAISHYFGISASDQERARIQRRMQFHSKKPGEEFRSDHAHKQQAFDACERDTIQRTLTPLHRKLLGFTQSQAKEAVAC